MRQPAPFGKYLLLERISVGGMAEVFKAKQFGLEGFEKILAIKRILPSMAEDADFIQMFIDEAKICAQLNHANICQIFELGRVADSHFIAMEYIWGKDLLQIQNRFRRTRKTLPNAMAAFIASKVCEGLDYAHRKKDATGRPLGIIHRDVSPQNILISYEGEIRIIDFGIAKAASRSSKTQAGVLKGKFGYMSPEHVRGLPLDRRSDIFAIGTILYELLTNERLFLGESDFATLEKVRNVDVPPPSTVNNQVPPALDQIVMKALAREVEDRYQHASEMQEALANYLNAEDAVYNGKMLAGWMREQFRAEMQKEAAVLEQQRGIGPQAMGAAAPPRSLAPPSTRLRPGVSPLGAGPVSGSGLPATAAAADPIPTPEIADHSTVEGLDPADLIDEAEDDPFSGEKTSISTDALSSEKTAIAADMLPVPAADAQPGDLPTESTRILDEGAEKPGEELPSAPTVVFNAGAPGAPAPPPPAAASSVVQPPAVEVLASKQSQPQPAYAVPQQPSLVAPGMPVAMTSGPQAAQPYGALPYGTGAFVAVQMPGGGTGMVMLPQGQYMTGAYALPQQPPPTPPRQNFLWKDIVVGVLAAITVVAVVLGIKFLMAPGRGTIILTVYPPQAAEVALDGKVVGRMQPGGSLLLREVARGQHRLRVRADDLEAQQAVNVNSGDTIQLTMQMAPAAGAQQSGSIKLRVPPGAMVSIDNRLVSNNDVQKGYLVAAGVAHEVSVTKPGMRKQQLSITVKPGAVEERDVVLQAARGRLVIKTTPPDAEVTIDGSSRGKAPMTLDDLEPGREMKVSVKRRGYATITRLVTFDDARGYDQTLDLQLSSGSSRSKPEEAATPGAGTPPKVEEPTSNEPGFLVANTKPWAKVFIDGKDTNKTTPIAPRDRIELKPGKHTVTFVANGRKYPFEVVIKPGHETKLLKDLSDSN